MRSERRHDGKMMYDEDYRAPGERPAWLRQAAAVRPPEFRYRYTMIGPRGLMDRVLAATTEDSLKSLVRAHDIKHRAAMDQYLAGE